MIGEGKYGKWTFRSDGSEGHEEMGREKKTKDDQFENKSKDEPGDRLH